MTPSYCRWGNGDSERLYVDWLPNHAWGLVKSENVGLLLQSLLRISGQWQQSSEPSPRPSVHRTPCDYTGHTPTTPGLVQWQPRVPTARKGHGWRSDCSHRHWGNSWQGRSDRLGGWVPAINAAPNEDESEISGFKPLTFWGCLLLTHGVASLRLRPPSQPLGWRARCWAETSKAPWFSPCMFSSCMSQPFRESWNHCIGSQADFHNKINNK